MYYHSLCVKIPVHRRGAVSMECAQTNLVRISHFRSEILIDMLTFLRDRIDQLGRDGSGGHDEEMREERVGI